MKKLINALRFGGPKTRKWLLATLNIPESSLDRYLKDFKEIGLFKKINGEYWWYAHKRVYLNREEYEQYLQHSKLLVEKALLPTLKDSHPVKTRHWKYLLQHLKTGHPDLHRLFLDEEEKGIRLTEERKVVKGRIVHRVKEFEFASKLSRNTKVNTVEIIYDSLLDTLRGRPPILEKLKIDDNGKAVCGTYTELAEGETAVRLVDAIKKECRPSNLDLFRTLVTLENEHSAFREKTLSESIRHKDMVVHGTPLNGECEICPEVLVKEELPAGKSTRDVYTSRGSNREYKSHGSTGDSRG